MFNFIKTYVYLDVSVFERHHDSRVSRKMCVCVCDAAYFFNGIFQYNPTLT